MLTEKLLNLINNMQLMCKGNIIETLAILCTLQTISSLILVYFIS